MDMIDEGFDQVVSVQNNSGHGTDLIGRHSKTGEVKVWEVKTTTTDRAPSLSKDQANKGGENYTANRLKRAAGGRGNFGKLPNVRAIGQDALDWIAQATAKKAPVSYERREVFVDDIEKGCSKHPARSSRSKPWPAK